MGTRNERKNAVAFTKKAIVALNPPKSGRVYWYDKGQANLAVCVTSAGSVTFYRTGRFKGKAQRVRLGAFPDMTVAKARSAAREANGKIATGGDPRPDKISGLTVGHLAEHWMIYARKHKKSAPNDQWKLDRYFADILKKRAVDVTPLLVGKWHEKLGEEHGHVTANRCKVLLGAMFRRGHQIGYEGQNPCRHVEPFREESRTRFLQKDEMRGFLEAVAEEEPQWRDYWLLALFTGARCGNISSMRWPDLNLDAGLWTVGAADMKAKQDVVIVLPDPAVAVLRSRLENKRRSDFVFPAPRAKAGHVRSNVQSFKRIRERCGIDDITPHDLRRTVGSWMAIDGASPTIIGAALSHKPGSTATAVYSRLTVEPVQRAVGSVVGDMLALLNGKGAEDV